MDLSVLFSFLVLTDLLKKQIAFIINKNVNSTGSVVDKTYGR